MGFLLINKQQKLPRVGERLAGNKAGQDTARQDQDTTRVHSTMNWHRTANTRRINREQMRKVTRETKVGQMNQ